jgi:hypothetical protein
MNDIYEQKAKKYKYKYLKLKKKYIGEGGLQIDELALMEYLNMHLDKLNKPDQEQLRNLYYKFNSQSDEEKNNDKIILRRLNSDQEQYEALKEYQIKQPANAWSNQPQQAQKAQNSAPRLLQQARRAPQAQSLQNAWSNQPQEAQKAQSLQNAWSNQPQQARRAQSLQNQQQARQALETRPQALETRPQALETRPQAPQALLALEKTLQAQSTKIPHKQQSLAVTSSFNKEPPIEHSKAPLKHELVHSNIGEGSFGCIISPPYNFTNELDVRNIFNIYDIEYVGKLIIIVDESDNKSFMKEVENNKIISDIYDIEGKYTSKFMFSQYINYDIVIENIKHINGLEKCLKNHNLYKYTINKFGYMIFKNVGTSFFKFFNLNLRKRKLDDFKLILKNLKESIEQFFINKNFYNDEYIHGDINFQNMTLDNNLNVYFIDFGLMQKYTDLNKINGLNLQYLQILYFLQFFELDIKNNIKYTKNGLITQINNLKNEFKNGSREHDNDGSNNIKTRYDTKDLLEKKFLKFINYEYFFRSIKNGNEQHFLNDFFNPIAKNIDIYALSLFIYQLFYHIPNQTKLNINININIELIDPNAKELITNILNALMRNALYNNINGPEELIIYLDGIIESMDNKYKKGTIPERIKFLRDSKNEQFYDYYYNFYIEVPVLTNNDNKFYY